MPKLLYSAADQTAVVQGAPNPGVDIVPGNVVKVIFVALADFSMTAATILLSATWTTFLADTTKTHGITPFIDGFDIPPTAPITEAGNDNTTVNGVPRTRSTGFATAKGKISAADPTQIKALRKLAGKSGNYQQGTRLGALFVYEGTGLGAMSPLTTGGSVRPFPVYNVFFSDPKKGGLGASNDYDFEFHMQGGWADDEVIYQLGFEGAVLTNPVPA
ncbi:hypothetical protein GCM10028818_41110 [Spirosoma horti]